MNTTAAQPALTILETAIRLSQDVETQHQAHAVFQDLYERLRKQDPEMATLLQVLWREYVTSQRSATFWQELCQVEKHLSEKIAENHLQLRQNYLRLVREQ